MNISYPLQGKSFEKTSDFGPRWGRQHKGIDLAADPGTRVVAVADGEIVKAGNFNDGFGGQVLIKHVTEDGKVFYTRYAHLNKWYARENEKITKGEKIGESGGEKGHPNAGRSEGPHLHFELLDGGLVAKDPEPYLKGAAIGALATAAVLTKDGGESKSGNKETTYTPGKYGELQKDGNNLVDKIMKTALKVITPAAAVTSLKGLSEPKEEDEKLNEEISRIKQLL
jgi:hypothetical protein